MYSRITRRIGRHGCALAGLLLTITVVSAQGLPNLVSYFGPGTKSQLLGVRQLADGTVLVCGAADHVDWVEPGRRTVLAAGSIAGGNRQRVGFIARLSPDLSEIQRLYHFPANAVDSVRHLRTTEVPGQPLGDLFISGENAGGYFIARLDGNFLTAEPTGPVWAVNVATTDGDSKTYQSWDVGSDGRLIYQEGVPSGNFLKFRNPDGTPRVLPDLRASHYVAGAPVKGIGSEVAGATHSQINVPSDWQSWTDADRTTVLPDGNGQIKMGRWPCDLVLTREIATGNPIRVINGTNYGYTGYRAAGAYRVMGVAVDRRDNHFYVGFNIQSKAFDGTQEQPDFEPGVVAYDDRGGLKWWSRLYHEVIDENHNGLIEPSEAQISLPDQYVDALAIDYSRDDPEGACLVVVARQHGNNSRPLWSGNAVAAHPGQGAFQNRFTGTEGNIHISWIGRLRTSDGRLEACTFLAGFFRKIISGKGNWPTVAYADPNLDGWPDHNVGWPDLTSTTIPPNSVRVDSAGRVYLVGAGPRMVTTRYAHQKLPRRLGHTNPTLNEGTCPWNHWVRVYASDLSTLVYSSVLTGMWSYPSGLDSDPVGAADPVLEAVFPDAGGEGLLVVGTHPADASNVARPNPVPVTAPLPAWGAATPVGQTALLARLHFTNGANAARVDNDGDGGETVVLHAYTKSTDFGVTDHAWFAGDLPLGTGLQLAARFAPGSHQVTLQYHNAAGTPQTRLFTVAVAPGLAQAGAGLTNDPDGLHLGFPTVPGLGYQLQRSSDLRTWSAVPGALLQGTGAPAAFPLPAPTGLEFHRVSVFLAP